jgi:2-oxoglutarate decarboxylase
MLADLLRPRWQWLLWNRRRFCAAVAIAVVFLALAARLAGGSQAAAPSPAARREPAAARTIPAASATGTQAPATTSPAAAPPAAPAAAAAAAAHFAAAWVSHGQARAARLRATASVALAAQLIGQNPARDLATRVTGSAAGTQLSPVSASLTVPTNAGPALITVRLIRGRWVATSVLLAATGG